MDDKITYNWDNEVKPKLNSKYTEEIKDAYINLARATTDKQRDEIRSNINELEKLEKEDLESQMEDSYQQVRITDDSTGKEYYMLKSEYDKNIKDGKVCVIFTLNGPLMCTREEFRVATQMQKDFNKNLNKLKKKNK